MIKLISFFVCIEVLLFSISGFAADVKEFEYPELLVSPSASDRLQQEAKAEPRTRWTNQWTIQISALTTLMAGMSSNSDPGKNAESAAAKGEEVASKSAAKMATYVGGGWLIGTLALSAVYNPYSSGVSHLQGLPQTSKKEKLAYERYAEEALYAPAQVASVMKWASFVTNAGANAMVIQGAFNSTTKFMGIVGIVGSTLPLVFEHRWNEVNRVQGDYKKRIYGSLTSANISILPRGDGMSAVTNLAWSF